MASQGTKASNVSKILEEERGQWETCKDARRKRKAKVMSPMSRDVITAFEGRLAKLELAMGDVHE